MNITEWARLLFALLAALAFGGLLGSVFLSTLWWTVLRLPHVRRPGLLYITSLLLRMTMVMAGFTAIAWFQDWRLLVAGLLGFVLVRTLSVRRVSLSAEVGDGRCADHH